MNVSTSTPIVVNNNGTVSIKSFGAIGDGVADDTKAIQDACDYCIANPSIASTVRIPIGNYRTTKPILLQNVQNGNYTFFTIKIQGDVSNKSASNQYLSRITVDFKEGYAIGIQLGRSIEIENLTILGKYQFPNSVNNANIGTTKFQDWADAATSEGITDTRYAPYAGISIDPDGNVAGGGGTSDVSIRNCSIRQWMVGVALTPNGVTANDEMINILETDIEACRVAVAVCQDQSKTINIKGLKTWASVHTILDGVTYGAGTGGGSVFCENWNIAGNCNQLFNIVNDRFPLSAINIYAESLFRIGRLGGRCGANLINCELDFLSGKGWPEADYLICGSANFYGGHIRYYDNDKTHRLNFVNTGSMFRDLTMNTVPITSGLYGGQANYPQPQFDNVKNYMWGSNIILGQDSLITLSPKPAIVIDRVKWTATVTGAAGIQVGDYILGAPNKTAYDTDLNPNRCPTAFIGRIVSITGNVANLDCVGLNVNTGDLYDAVFISRLK